MDKWPQCALFSQALKNGFSLCQNATEELEFTYLDERVKRNTKACLIISVELEVGHFLYIFTNVNTVGHDKVAQSAMIKIYLQQVVFAFFNFNRLDDQSNKSVLLLDNLTQLSILFKELASEWFWRTDSEMTFVSVNNIESEDNTYAQLFLNNKIASIITHKEQQNIDKWQRFSKMVEDCEDFNNFEFEVNASQRLWVSLNGKSQFDELGHFIGYLGIAKDITLSKEREVALESARLKAEDASKTKSKFLTVMSHEIRTPMNAIMGVIELLLDTKLTVEQRQWLDYANSSADILYGLITDVLDFSKIESGTILLVNKPLNVKLLIENIVGQLHIIEDSDDIIFSISIDDQVPTFIMGDEFRLGQILFNIIGNAFKYTRSGSISLRVYIENAQLNFEVKDSGVGIAQKDLALIFQPFRQVNDGINRKDEGVGLGLSISKNLIELMDGTIDVQTQLGLGSTFSIAIPFDTALESEVENVSSQNCSTLSVLVAEDNRTNQLLIKAFLEKLNHKVTIANDGAEAIEFMKLKNFDLILMDIMMPTMDGLTATQFIRNELLSDIPIFALTANAATDDKASCFKVGMNKVLTKPIKFETLKASLSGL
ncbi:hybrid sensor histidine kinase/response regulator [Pseudoalteromonas sp. H105]|nr:hybrid sensor histidine kinase/response regulator [Pseudoalteromonas sp. H105]